MIDSQNHAVRGLTDMMPDGEGDWQPVPQLMTEDELIRFLRIPEISKASDYSNVIDNLRRMHDLPCIHNRSIRSVLSANGSRRSSKRSKKYDFTFPILIYQVYIGGGPVLPVGWSQKGG